MNRSPLEITEVRVQLMEGRGPKVRAFCSVTFADQFVVRDLKVIASEQGDFVAMPSRKLADRCGGCGEKNAMRARFCNQCGQKLDPQRALRNQEGRARLHADLAHPINRECRTRIERAVLEAFQLELQRSEAEGYVPQRFDDFEDDDAVDFGPLTESDPEAQQEAAGG